MNTQPHKPRNLEESRLFEKHKNEITKDTQLLDTILNGVTLTIALDPTQFPIAEQTTGIRIVKAHGAGDVPNLTIYFRESHSDPKIILVDIEITPE